MSTRAGSLRKRAIGRGLNAVAGLALAGLVAACATPIVANRGYAPRADELERVQPGVDTRETVARRLGRPSTVGAIDDDVWYYISMRREAVAFFEPAVTAQRVVAVSFDDAGRVADIGNYGLEDGRVINLATRETPTSGRQLTFIQQIFENVGRPPFGRSVAP